MKIAVDGASATGKSTVCAEVSKRLNILHLDTGAMYRVAGLKAFQSGLDTGAGVIEESVGILLKNLNIDIKYIDKMQREFLDGEDVSVKIREHHISKLASDISAVPALRAFMVDLQRQIAARQPCVLDGRDIGTYVLPDADYKFFLTAELECRAKRRYNELIARGQAADFEKIKEDIRQRDYNDSNRAFAPLKKADRAVEIDSTKMTADEVVELMLNTIKA